MRYLILSFLLLFFSNAKAQTATMIVKSMFQDGTITTNSSIYFEISLSSGWVNNETSITSLKLFSINGGTNTLIKTYSTTFSNSATEINIAPGIYKYEGTVSTKVGRSFVSVPVNKFFYVSTRSYWEQSRELTWSESTGSLSRTLQNTYYSLGYAKVKNTTSALSQNGWIQMRKNTSLSSTNNSIYWVLEPVSTPSSFTSSMNTTYIEFKTVNNVHTIYVKYKQTNGTYLYQQLTTAAGNDLIRIVRRNSQTWIEKNDAFTSLLNLDYLTGGLSNQIFFSTNNCGLTEFCSNLSNVTQQNTPVKHLFVEDIEKNSFTFNVSQLADVTAPYSYVISPTLIPELKTVYQEFLDSNLVNPTDSINFLKGSISASTLTVNGLESGDYEASIFDNTGKRVYKTNYSIQNTLPTSELINMLKVNDGLFVGSNNSYTVFNVNTPKEVESVFKLKVEDVIKEMAFGMKLQTRSVNPTTNIHLSIDQGVYIKNGMLQFIINNAMSVVDQGVTNGDIIEFVLLNDVMKLYRNGTLLNTFNLTPASSYKPTIVAVAKNTLIPFLLSGFTKKPFIISNVITNRTCTNDKVSFTLNIPAIGSTNTLGQSLTSRSFQLTDVLNGLSNVGPANQTVFTDIAPGVYKLSGSLTYTSTSYPFVQYIYAGKNPDFNQIQNVYAQSTNTTLVPHVLKNTASSTGEAIIVNKLDAGQSGWIAFMAKSKTLSPIGSRLILAESPLLNDFYPGASQYPQIRFSNSNPSIVHAYNPTTGTFSLVSGFNPAMMFVVNRDATNNVELRQLDQQLIPDLTGFPSLRWKPVFRAAYTGFGFANITTGFLCGTNTGQFAQLKYEMDGYYHIFNDGKINFVFNQEYDAANLQFKIFNGNDLQIRTQADYPIVPTTNGMNYLSINLDNGTCAFPKGFYYLEVTNSKKEKMYLRFYYDYNSPLPVCTENPNE